MNIRYHQRSEIKAESSEKQKAGPAANSRSSRSRRSRRKVEFEEIYIPAYMYESAGFFIQKNGNKKTIASSS